MPDEPYIEINIQPREEVLKALGVSREEFEVALKTALDRYDSETGDEMPPIHELSLMLQGQERRLEELATIEIGGDPDLLRKILEDEDP